MPAAALAMRDLSASDDCRSFFKINIYSIEAIDILLDGTPSPTQKKTSSQSAFPAKRPKIRRLPFDSKHPFPFASALEVEQIALHFAATY